MDKKLEEKLIKSIKKQLKLEKELSDLPAKAKAKREEINKLSKFIGNELGNLNTCDAMDIVEMYSELEVQIKGK